MCVFYFMSFYFAYALSAILFSSLLSYFACVLCLSVKFAFILYLFFLHVFLMQWCCLFPVLVWTARTAGKGNSITFFYS